MSVNLRIATTTLTSFDYFLKSEMTTEDYIQNLFAGFVPTPAMEVGTAYHRLIEKGVEEENKIFVNSGRFLTVKPEIMKPALQYRDQHPNMVHEVKATKQYGNVTVVAKVDGLEGYEIEEHKTTGYFRPEAYINSYQPKFYLDVFEADACHFNVFEFAPLSGATAEAMARGINNVNTYRLTVERYDNLQRDCFALVQDFVTFLELNKITHIFDKK